jgi:hypothetical protein
VTEYFSVVSGEMPENLRESLRKSFAEVIPLPPDADLAAPVCCHPDMIFAVLADRLFVSRRYFRENAAVIEKISSCGGFAIHPADDRRSAVYPYDVAFNAAVWRDCVICRPESTSAALLDFAHRQGYRIVPVKQGYTACSCIVTDDAVLTSDRGIIKSLNRAEIPCVLLPEGGIALPGYDCGFPGGACGYHHGVIYLCGDADTLPCAEILRQRGHRIVSLASSGSPVTDYGGIRIFQKK